MTGNNDPDAEAAKRIESMLDEFDDHIDHYRVTLNDEGMWLFLAVLGCWGVEQRQFQIAALFLTFGLFVYRLFSKLKDPRSFSRRRRELEEAIRSDLSYEGQQPLFGKLKKLAEDKLSNKSHITSTYAYAACHAYLAGTLIYLWLGA